jgi:hypothetical protein
VQGSENAVSLLLNQPTEQTSQLLKGTWSSVRVFFVGGAVSKPPLKCALNTETIVGTDGPIGSIRYVARSRVQADFILPFGFYSLFSIS